MNFNLVLKILLSFAVSIILLGFTYEVVNVDFDKQDKDKWNIPKDAAKLKNPTLRHKDAALDGKKIFLQSCISCHGINGLGNGPASVSMTNKPDNLTSDEVQKQPDGILFWKISNGHRTMISWKFSLSERQRWFLVDYLRVLGNKSK